MACLALVLQAMSLPPCRCVGAEATSTPQPLPQPTPARRPNIILILTDDQGYGELGCHGNPILKTPNLDRLHGESVRFNDFQVSPTCAPTRCAIMTGRHEFKSGVTHTIAERERMSLKPIILPQVLKKAGYTTGIFGKWHLGDEPERHPAKRGFDYTCIHGGGGIGQTYPGTCGDAPENTYHNPWVMRNGVFEKSTGYCTDVFFSNAERWIAEQSRSGKPFFAMITPNAPHDPFVSPGEDWEAPYRNRGLSTNEIRYYAMIANIDANVGRFVTSLDRLGVATNTVVIFMTDNGHSVPSLYNAGMRGAKGGPYQGGTRVPSFWRWPGHWTPGERNQLAAHIDILPTLAGLAGAALEKDGMATQVEGRSLVPLLDSDGASWTDRYLYVHLGRWPRGGVLDAKYKQCAVRSQRFRLVNNVELYDIQADPGEKTNVIDRYPETVRDMRLAYDRWWESTLPFLENETAVPPRVNPYKALFWKQLGGGPDAALAARMDPASPVSRRDFSTLVP